MRRTLAATALLLLSTTLAFGQQSGSQDDPPLDCANAQTQADMNQCAYQDFEKADAELNTVYKDAMAAARANDKQALEMSEHYVGAVEELKKAQRAWIDYRDGHCDGMSREALGGSMQPMLISGCQTALTQNRTKELRELTTTLAGN